MIDSRDGWREREPGKSVQAVQLDEGDDHNDCHKITLTAHTHTHTQSSSITPVLINHADFSPC